MARQLRHHYAGGWYHITARGMGRQEIFETDRDREHFVELLAAMVGRYGQEDDLTELDDAAIAELRDRLTA